MNYRNKDIIKFICLTGIAVFLFSIAHAGSVNASNVVSSCEGWSSQFNENGMAGPFSGEVLKPIVVAVDKLEAQGLHLENYVVKVYLNVDECRYEVLFKDASLPPLTRAGKSKDNPAFQVFIDKKTMDVEACYLSVLGKGVMPVK